MSTIDLIILGLLSHQPMSAYDLVCAIKNNFVDKFLKISTPAVYKGSLQLYKLGFLDHQVLKVGDNPEKKIYQINDTGKKYFLELMNHFSSHFNPFFLDCNAFLWNIDSLEKSEGIRLLTNLHSTILELNVWIIQHEKDSKGLPFANRAIIKQYRMMLSILNLWCQETIEEYKIQSKF